MFKVTLLFWLTLAFKLKELEATGTSEVLHQDQEPLDNMTNTPRNENLTLLIGLTGAGKSTMSLYLTANLTEMEAYRKGADIAIKHKNSTKISHANQAFTSKTSIPEAFTDPETTSVLYDFPGFGDTRGAEEQLQNGQLMNKVVDGAENVRFLFIENYGSLQGEDRGRLVRLISMTLQFVRNLKAYQGGVALVATKAQVFANVSDTEVVAGIAESLEEVRKLRWTDQQKPHVEALLDSWLMQDANGAYPNIVFFSQPTQVGLLSDLPGLVANKKWIRQMVFNNSHFQYQPCNASDFGASLSPGAILELHGVQKKRLGTMKKTLGSVEKAGVDAVSRLKIDQVLGMGDVVNAFEKSKKDFDAAVTVFEAIGKVGEHEEILNKTGELKVDWKNMSRMETLLKGIPNAELSLTSEATEVALNAVKDIIGAMGSKLKTEINVDAPLAKLENVMDERFKSGGLSEIRFWRYLTFVDSSIKQLVADYVENVGALNELAMKMELEESEEGKLALKTLEDHVRLLKYLDAWDAAGAAAFRKVINSKFKGVLRRVAAENKELWSKTLNKFRHGC